MRSTLLEVSWLERYSTTKEASPGHIYLWAAYSVVNAVDTDWITTGSLYRYLQ